MGYTVTIQPRGLQIRTPGGVSLLSVLRQAGVGPDAPCGGEGTCGKCRVMVDGQEALACRTTVDRNMTVLLPETEVSPTDGSGAAPEVPVLAFDVGTTTVVGYLLDGKTGETRCSVDMRNPQTAYGADVITRIRHGVQGQMAALTVALRTCLEEMSLRLCEAGSVLPEEIQLVSVVGNPAMQQFLLGIPVGNLAKVPFAPALTEETLLPAVEILPALCNAWLLTAADIAGFVGADTVACVVETEQDLREEMTLLVDIGTNGEMVLGNRHGLAACSAAAGPALEGAGIQFGMRGQAGAIDHVWLENGRLQCSVIGGGSAVGICGSGLIDAVAAALEAGWINERGKILLPDGEIPLPDGVRLTQEDIRQVQLAKGAIAAGIRLLADHMECPMEKISAVWLAGAFGSHMDPAAACRIGLLPVELQDRIVPVGNAAGAGAKRLALDPGARERAGRIAAGTTALELNEIPVFPRCFARSMRF